MKPPFASTFSLKSPWTTFLWAGAFWTLVLCGLAAQNYWDSHRELEQITLSRARSSFEKDVAYRLWATQRGGVYAPLDEKTPPNPYLAHLPDREIRADNGKTYTLVNPAYMTRMVHELAAKEYGHQGHITSLHPIRPENAADPWEQQALQLFEKGAREHWEKVTVNGQPQLRYMGAFLVTQGCLRCHAQQGYKVGDVRGGISVTVPMSFQEYGATLVHFQKSLLALGALWLLGLGGLFYWVRNMTRIERARLDAVASLEESRSLYQSLAEDIPVSLFRRDKADRLVYANLAMLRDLGQPLENCLGHGHLEHHPAEQAAMLQEEDAQVLAGTSLRRVRPYRVPSSGETQIREVAKTPVRNAAGEIVGIQGVSWDVTERVQQDKAVRLLLEQYQAVLQTAADGFLRIGPDERILEVNDAYCRISGYSREELLEKRLQDLVENESPAAVSARYQKARKDGAGYFQVQHRAKNGKRIDLDISVTFVPSLDFFVVFLRDITERLHAEVQLAESVALFRLVTEQTPIPIFLHREGRFLYVNPAALHLLGAPSLEDLIGSPVVDRIHPDFRGIVQERIRIVYSGAEIAPPLEEKFLRLDGGVIDVEVSGVPVNYLGTEAMLVFAQDITGRKLALEEKKRLETEVLHMQKIESLGRLAGGVAHDMNNVLGAIMAIGSMLEMKYKGIPGLKKDSDDLVNAASRGRDLVKGLNQFARKELLEPIVLDLNELVRREAELLNRTTLKAVEVVLDLDEPLAAVRGEANVLSNALMNLCVNALDAMHGKGRLKLQTRNLPPDQVELVVTDSGEGMAPEILARAMDPFFTTKPSGKGTGLGLSMVYGAVKSHGGSLALQSEPGEGTRVIIRLPSTHSQAAIPGEPEAAPARPSSHLDVLVVDDDEMILATLPLMLTTQGHRVVAASSGAEALRRLEAGLKVDLLLLDMNMPGMDGLETLGRIRMFRPELPVLMATGNSADPNIEEVIARDGRASLIRKPFTYDELGEKIAAFLA